MGESFPGDRKSQVDRFCYQCLQQETHLDFPEGPILREDTVQREIFHRVFSEDGPRFRPPERYRIRVLEKLVEHIERSIEDSNDHEVYGEIWKALFDLLAVPLPPEPTSMQQKSYVTYHLAQLPPLDSTVGLPESSITLLESRSLLSASGTTGMRTWDSALHLGQFLSANPDIIRGKRVLELGAGTGYLSLLCAKFLNAAHVIASDGSDDVIDNLSSSLFLNDLQGSNSVRIMDLKWGHALLGTEEDRWNGGEAIDVVLGADVTFDDRAHPWLIGTLTELLELFPNLEIILSNPERSVDTMDSFEARCRAAGLALSDISVPVPPKSAQLGPFYSDAVSIRLSRVQNLRSAGT